MSIQDRYQAYADAFEESYEDDDWSRIGPYFTEDAAYEGDPPGEGREGVVTKLKNAVDGFDRNHKLGLICEAKVGRGRLLICSIDLPGLQEHPEARQLMASLTRYAASGAFKPSAELDAEVIGFDAEGVLLMPLGPLSGVLVKTKVWSVGTEFLVPSGAAVRGSRTQHTGSHTASCTSVVPVTCKKPPRSTPPTLSC